MRSDTIHGTSLFHIQGADEEEETDELVNQVLDEIGISNLTEVPSTCCIATMPLGILCTRLQGFKRFMSIESSMHLQLMYDLAVSA
jgi:hypothetical protein